MAGNASGGAAPLTAQDGRLARNNSGNKTPAPILYDMRDADPQPASFHHFPAEMDAPVHATNALSPRQISFTRDHPDSRFPAHFSTLSASNLSLSSSSVRLARPRHNSFNPDSPPPDMHPLNRLPPHPSTVAAAGVGAGAPRTRAHNEFTRVARASTPAPAGVPDGRETLMARDGSLSASVLQRPSVPLKPISPGAMLPDIELTDDPSLARLPPRRAKTAMPGALPGPLQPPRRQRGEVMPSPSMLQAARHVDESPYSRRLTMRRSDSLSEVETKLYNAYVDALHDEARSRAGGLRTIVNLLRDCEGNPIVIEKAALAIACLCENDGASRDVFGQYSAVQMLIQCLSIRIPSKYDRAATVEMIVLALMCLLKDSPRNVRLFEMFDGAHKMGKAAASERFENYPTIATHVLKALSELKHHAVYTADGGGSPANLSRTLRYVVRAMSVHEHRADVQERAVDALRTLIARAEHGVLSTSVLKGCVQATATAFQMHGDSRELQWQCLALLCELEDVRDGLFAAPMDVRCFFGALRGVVAEAKEHSKRNVRIGKALVGVIRRGIEVAVGNSWRCAEFKDTAVENGAVETMLQALHLFEGDVRMVDKICTILRVLLQSEEGQFRMNSVDSACAILSGIEAANAKCVQAQLHAPMSPSSPPQRTLGIKEHVMQEHMETMQSHRAQEHDQRQREHAQHGPARGVRAVHEVNFNSHSALATAS